MGLIRKVLTKTGIKKTAGDIVVVKDQTKGL